VIDLLVKIGRGLELLSGARAPRRDTPARRLAWGVWWAILFLAIFVAMGRATKFIYVDF
jgi:hypothetical protein